MPETRARDPLFKGQFATSTQLTLLSVLRTLMVIMPVIAVGTIPISRPLETVAMAGLCVVVVGLFLLARAGHVERTIQVLVGALVVYGCVGVVANGSVRGIATMAFVGAIVVGGLFLRRNALIGVFLACTACIGMLILAEVREWIGPAKFALSVFHWPVYVLVLGGIALNIHYARSLILKALDRSEAEARERTRAERALGEAEEVFEALFQSSPAALMMTTYPGQTISEINRAHVRMFGFAPEFAIGKTSRELGVWEDVGKRTSFMEDIGAGAVIVNQPVRFRRASGEVFDALVSAQLVDWRGGRHLLSVATDISAETRLRDSVRDAERRFAAIFRDGPVAAVITRFESGAIVDINLEAERLLGITREQAAGVASAGFVSDAAFWHEARTTLIRERRLRKLPVVLQSADGDTQRKALVTSTLVEENGERFAVNLIEDLTAEEAARAALDRSEKRFATVFRESPIGMVITDFDHSTIVDVNQAFLEIMGFKRDDLFGTSPRDVYVDPAQHVRVREAMSTQGVIHDYPISIRDSEGRSRELLLSAVVFREGEARLSVNMVVDVTQQTRIREALRASEERFSRAFQFSPIGMTITRVSDGRILEVNKADERVLGYTQGETIGRTTLETGAWASTADRERFVAILRREGRVLSYETRMRNKAGELIDARVFAEAMEINGEPCILGAVLNVTEEKRQSDEIRALNESLERRVEERTAEVSAANAELEAFVYAVSHDLRGPLRAVNGFAELLKEELGPGCTQAQAEMVDRIRRGGTRMDQLIEDLLRLSRIGRLEIRRVAVDLSAMALDVAAALTAEDPKRVVEWHVADGMVAECDASLVRIVLENLLGNAWKYTARRDAARIEFRSEPLEGGGARFVIADNGAGFDMRYAERLFKPFSRLHTDAQFEGTGIGLSTVKRIVVRHGGSICVTAAPGEGATVRFTLRAETA